MEINTLMLQLALEVKAKEVMKKEGSINHVDALLEVIAKQILM